MKAAVFNASPLIILARSGQLSLVPRMFSPVVVPRAVADEIADDLPADLAKNLDYYIHGHPKICA